MAIISVGVEILYVKSRIEQKPKNPKEPRAFSTDVERYRAKYSSFDNLKDLMKYQIDIITEKYNLEDIISIKFTG